MKILILGANGMFANELIKNLSTSSWDIYGTTRKSIKSNSSNNISNFTLLGGIDFTNLDTVYRAIEEIQPNIVLNLVGITKYKEKTSTNIEIIEVNSLAPHKIAKFCETTSSRFIQLSTDCVFSGSKGSYDDLDIPDPIDLYGQTKALGELSQYKNSLTIRTSFIGHNNFSKDGLLEWFLDQSETWKGYKTAIYSGVTTIELANIFREYIFEDITLSGIYNISASRISKYDLLKLVSRIYKKNIKIIPSSAWVIDRSLNSNRFKVATGYNSPEWEKMIATMWSNRKNDI